MKDLYKPCPPAGWPYVVLPAEPAQAPEQATERRRLADNVVCMFGDEREPVANMRWRGRYPRTVTRMYHHRRLYAGAYCVLWHPRDERNHGCVVQLLESALRPREHWHVRAISRPVHVHWLNELDNSESHEEAWSCLASSASLRRCAPPFGHWRGAP